ncbi:MAG: hypothetical protein K6F44_06700, partial [Lachnospiraceae bacterium]|nr:hypothetical protein [Lachnospiraceae bacterium]
GGQGGTGGTGGSGGSGGSGGAGGNGGQGGQGGNGGNGGNGGSIEGSKTLYKYLRLRRVEPFANRLSIDYGVEDPELAYGQIYLSVIPVDKDGKADEDNYKWYVFPVDRAQINEVTYYGGIDKTSGQKVNIVPGETYIVGLGYVSFEDMENDSDVPFDQYITVRTPQLYSNIYLDSITPVGTATGDAISMRFTVNLDPLIDTAYVEIVDATTGTVVDVTGENPAGEVPGKARWKVNMVPAAQTGDVYTLGYGRNDQDLIIRITDVEYGKVPYPLNCELYVKRLY